ncbi:DUF2804 domain-containing protein [Shewanella sp. HL-SH2]|uniref:DUF2804 domain-containing protein n=1 Tax=Shewanella sp. HL-SH2 TaxID=3436238 RepID=UPI003EB6D8FB
MQLVQPQFAPESLIGHDGQPVFGLFDGSVKNLNVKAFKYFNEMDKPASFVAKYFDFKQFQFVSIVTQRYILGLAIADIRYAASSFCYLYDIQANRLVQSEWLRPFGIGCRLSASASKGSAKVGSKHHHFEFDIKDGQWQVNILLTNIQAKLVLSPPTLSLPLSLSTPTGYNGWTYTQKHNALAVSGELTVFNEPQPLLNALASYDFSAGYMRAKTAWRWASINALTSQGAIGLNLAAGVNETGNTENVMWINGQRHFLGAANFIFNRQISDDFWQISTNDGQVDLTFRALNCRKEKLNLGFIKNNFRQYIGYYSGILIDNDGTKYHLHNQLGLAEDHFAKW